MDKLLNNIIINRISMIINSGTTALMGKRQQLLNDAASRGFPLTPGETQDQIKKLHENFHTNLPRLIIQEMRDVLLKAKPKPSPELAMELKKIVLSYCISTNKLQSSLKFQGIDPAIAETAIIGSPEGFFTEIDLIMNELENIGKGDEMNLKSSTTNYHINAPGGIVQTGNHSTANLMTLNQNQQNDIIIALDHLKMAVNNVAEIQGDSKEEVIDLIEESKSEVLKTQPNKTRLKSFLTGIASGIQTCASLKPTYDASKTILLPFGITLPNLE